MKTIVCILCMALSTLSVLAAHEDVVPSTIKKVTIFTEGAQVYRNAYYSVGKGITKIIIENVSDFVDEKSIQVKATGDIVILDTRFSIYQPQPEEFKLEGLPLKIVKEIEQLSDSIETVNFSIQTIQNEIDVLNATKNILINNGAVNGKGKVNDSIGLLKATVDYYLLKMNELNASIGKLNLKKEEKMRLKKKLNERLSSLKSYQNSNNLTPKKMGPIPRIVITVQANVDVKGKIDLSYIVSNAGWTPSYDIMSDIENGKVLLNYKAQVYQNTGEKWENVLLSISTNNPYQNKTKPELHPWYISYYNNYYQQPATPQPVSIVKTESLQKTSSKAEVATNYDSDEAALSASDFTQVINRTISAEFAINLPYTIESNNEPHIVLISKNELNASFLYYTVPKLDNHAYLVARLTKLEELQLVPASASIFFEGSYMGETYIDPSSMSDTLNLSLGKDPNIIVKRTNLKNDVNKKIVGNQIEQTFAYQIEVKNLKSKNVEIIVEDQIPVTQIGEIEIALLDNSKAKYDAVTGKLEWNLKLRPNQMDVLKYKCQIKYNKEKQLAL
ncbi:MAG TPA: DUF4139 domain-containing protein [Taishania sp.]|nr:DUF4139 domain-containing protein [Taishania sp.]